MRTIENINNASLPESSSAGKLTYSTDALSDQGQWAALCLEPNSIHSSVFLWGGGESGFYTGSGFLKDSPGT